MKSRKLILGVVACTLLLAVAGAACGAAFDWQQFKGETVNVLALRFFYNELIGEKLAEFEALTGMKVVFETYPYEPMLQKHLVEFTGASERTDVYNLGPTSFGRKYYVSGWCEPLEPYVQNAQITAPDWDFLDFLPSVRNASVIDGTRVGIPVNAVTWLLYYRKDLYVEHGLTIPQTMEDMRSNAAKLHTGDIYGWVSRGNRVQSVPIWGIFLHAFGGQFVDDQRNPGVNSPEAIQSLEFFADLQRNYANPGAAENSHWEAVSLIQQGKAAQLIDTCTFIGLFEDPEKSTVYKDMGYARIPAGPGGRVAELWMWTFAISPYSKNKNPAWLFIQWATSAQMQGWIQTHKFPSARKSVWSNPEYTKAWPDDWTKSVRKSFEIASPICHPSVVEHGQITDVIGEAIVNVELGYDNPGDALNAAAAEMAEIMSATE